MIRPKPRVLLGGTSSEFCFLRMAGGSCKTRVAFFYLGCVFDNLRTSPALHVVDAVGLFQDHRLFTTTRTCHGSSRINELCRGNSVECVSVRDFSIKTTNSLFADK